MIKPYETGCSMARGFKAISNRWRKCPDFEPTFLAWLTGARPITTKNNCTKADFCENQNLQDGGCSGFFLTGEKS